MWKVNPWLILSIGVLDCGVVTAETSVHPEVPAHSVEVLSKTYTIDRVYTSMLGPASTQEVTLWDSGSPELLWVIGYRSEVVQPDGITPMSQEFMCHTSLGADMTALSERFGLSRRNFHRMMIGLSPGQSEIVFPEGFGMPVPSDQRLLVETAVLNRNPQQEPFDVKIKVTIDVIRDRDLIAPLKPLFLKSLMGLVLLEGQDGYYNVEHGDATRHGPGSSRGEPAPRPDAAPSAVWTDAFGRRFASHWMARPGREVNQTLVTKMLDLPFDTTVHYVMAHLHPFGESLELRDLTTGTTVFRSRFQNFPDRIGIEHAEHFASREGIPLVRDHEYELVSVYQNTTDRPQEVMAVMKLYLFDQELHQKLQTRRSEREYP